MSRNLRAVTVHPVPIRVRVTKPFTLRKLINEGLKNGHKNSHRFLCAPFLAFYFDDMIFRDVFSLFTFLDIDEVEKYWTRTVVVKKQRNKEKKNNF